MPGRYCFDTFQLQQSHRSGKKNNWRTFAATAAIPCVALRIGVTWCDGPTARRFRGLRQGPAHREAQQTLQALHRLGGRHRQPWQHLKHARGESSNLRGSKTHPGHKRNHWQKESESLNNPNSVPAKGKVTNLGSRLFGMHPD